MFVFSMCDYSRQSRSSPFSVLDYSRALIMSLHMEEELVLQQLSLLWRHSRNQVKKKKIQWQFWIRDVLQRRRDQNADHMQSLARVETQQCGKPFQISPDQLRHCPWSLFALESGNFHMVDNASLWLAGIKSFSSCRMLWHTVRCWNINCFYSSVQARHSPLRRIVSFCSQYGSSLWCFAMWCANQLCITYCEPGFIIHKPLSTFCMQACVSQQDGHSYNSFSYMSVCKAGIIVRWWDIA